LSKVIALLTHRRLRVLSLQAEPSCTELRRPLMPLFSHRMRSLTVLLAGEKRHSAAIPRLAPTATLLRSSPPRAQVPDERYPSRSSTRELQTSTPPLVSSTAPPPSLVLVSVGHPHRLLVACPQLGHSRAGATEHHHGVDFTTAQSSEPSASSLRTSALSHHRRGRVSLSSAIALPSATGCRPAPPSSARRPS
jgi:hypothetical protein